MIVLPITVDTKNLYQRDQNSFEIVNLLEKDYSNTANGQGLLGIDLFMVGKEEAMRPDLISKKMYGFLDPLERILKFNQISNPFSINTGDILVIWDIPSTEQNLRHSANVSERRIDIRNQYITPEKKSTVDPRYQDFSTRNTAPKADPTKGNQPALPPNLAGFGDQEIELRNGKLILGPNVTKTGQENEQPVSKSDFIANIIKNRIKNNSSSLSSQTVQSGNISAFEAAISAAAKKAAPKTTKTPAIIKSSVSTVAAKTTPQSSA